MGFVVERYESAPRFLEEAGPWLAANEADNNLVLALAHSLAGTDHPFHEPVFLAAVKRAAGSSAAPCARRPITST